MSLAAFFVEDTSSRASLAGCFPAWTSDTDRAKNPVRSEKIKEEARMVSLYEERGQQLITQKEEQKPSFFKGLLWLFITKAVFLRLSGGKTIYSDRIPVED